MNALGSHDVLVHDSPHDPSHSNPQGSGCIAILWRASVCTLLGKGSTDQDISGLPPLDSGLQATADPAPGRRGGICTHTHHPEVPCVGLLCLTVQWRRGVN